MAKLKVKKGLEANLPAVEDGSLLITTDSKKLYLDNGEERIQVGGDSSSAGTYLFHLKFTDGMETAVTNIDGDFSKLSTAVTNGMNVIARVHDYEDMVNFTDYYLATGTGSSTSPASPYELNYYDGLKLHSIVVNDFTDSGLSYSTSSTGVRTIVFTKTSDTEYSCSIDVALLVQENAVVGKVPNGDNNGYTFFYKVRDSIDNTSATPSDTVATTFISCDGDVIKKLTTQYSDYGVWHYSETSLSGGGGADSSIYTTTGIKTPSALTDGFPVMNNDASVTYARFNKGEITLTPVKDFNPVDSLCKATITSRSTLSNVKSLLNIAIGDSITVTGLSLHLSAHDFEVRPLNTATINYLGNTNNRWAKIYVDGLAGVGPRGASSANTRQLVFSSDAGISAPSSSNYAYTSFKFNTQCAGGPQGTGTYNNALIYGFDTPISTSLYSEYASALGTDTYPWKSASFQSTNLGSNSASTYGDANISFVGPDFSNSTNSTDYAQTRILQRFGTSPSAPTNSHTTNSRIQIGAQSQYVYPGGTSTESKSFTGMLDIETYIAGSYIGGLIVSPVAVTDISTSAYNMYLGSSQRPWTGITFGLPDSQENLQGSSIVITRKGGNYSSSSSSSSAITQTSTLTIQQESATPPTAAMTGGWHQQSQIKLQCDSRFKYNTNSSSFSASLLISNYPSPVNTASRFEVYPDLPTNDQYRSFLGTSAKPWTFTYTHNLYISGNRVLDFVSYSNSVYLNLTTSQMNGLPGSGKYMKRVWTSGMQEVWIELELGDITTWDAWGSLYEHAYGNAVQWPVTWAATPQVIMSASCSTDAVWVTPINPTTTTTGVISIKTAGNVARTGIKVHIYATGLAG